MNTFLAEVFSAQERNFKTHIMRDYLDFNKNYKDTTGFPSLEITSKEYELQKYFEVRLEHYLRTVINDVIGLILEDRGVGIYKSEIPEQYQHSNAFYTNFEYEELAGYEFAADYPDTTIVYRYTDISDAEAEERLTDFGEQLVIINWKHLAKVEVEKNRVLPSGKKIRYCCLWDLFQERIGEEEYQDFYIFLTGLVFGFQEFIGVRTVPDLSPLSLGKFRFEVEESIQTFIQKIRDLMIADQKIIDMGLSDIKPIDYGYIVIDDENRERYGTAAESSRQLLRESNILKDFESKRMYRYLIGGADFAKSLITSEYLYKHHDCNDCFDYTAIVSGYLKSVEQLLYHIVCFSKGKGYWIKNNGKKKHGKHPKSKRVGQVFKIALEADNDGYFDTTIGSLIHFLGDYKDDLILTENYKDTIIDCLNCYRIECRNDSFHLDNNYQWSRVEYIRWNTFLIYILLLNCCKLGDTESDTQKEFQIIEDDRLERLYNIISSGKKGKFEFIRVDDEFQEHQDILKHIAEESSYPSYDSIGRIKTVFLTFESLTNKRREIVMRRNVPEEMYFIDENGYRTAIE